MKRRFNILINRKLRTKLGVLQYRLYGKKPKYYNITFSPAKFNTTVPGEYTLEDWYKGKYSDYHKINLYK